MSDGKRLKDFDPPTEGVLITAAVANAAVGGALVAMSAPIHVILGSLLIGSGVFLFGWARLVVHYDTDYGQAPGREDYDPPTSRVILFTSAMNIAMGVILVVPRQGIHSALGGVLIVLGILLFAWLAYRDRPNRRA